MSDLLVLAVLVGLAAFRASRFLAKDSLLDAVRYRFFRRFPPTEFWCRHYRTRFTSGKPGSWQISDRPTRRPVWLGRLVECPWCSSVWFAAVIVAIVDLWCMPVRLPVLVWAAGCSVAGLCATLDSR